MYKITLKPTQDFFFGGEHGASEEKGYDRYYVRSEIFPQQTQILGMIRRTIMFNEDCLKVYPKGDFVPKSKRDKTKALVGSKWLMENDENIDLGKIVSLSPIFLSHGNTLFMQAPLDTGLSLHKREGVAYYNGIKSVPYQLMKDNCKPFDAKTYLYDGFLSCTGDLLRSCEVFMPTEQVGNKKLYDGGTDDDAFYKKRSYAFEDKAYGFTFFLKHAGIKPIENTIVTLGADKSKFMLSMEEIKDIECKSMFKSVNPAQKQHRIVLLSDSHIDTDMIKGCDFYLAYKKPFRYNKIAFETKDEKKRSVFSKSERIYFFTKGSVFFFESLENASEFSIKLHKHKSLMSIGYNEHILIEGEPNA